MLYESKEKRPRANRQLGMSELQNRDRSERKVSDHRRATEKGRQTDLVIRVRKVCGRHMTGKVETVTVER